jgi:NhaA family Na+:H+ antiporter
VSEQTGVRTLFRRPDSWPEAKFVGDVLRTETAGGLLLLLGAAVALLWANSPWGHVYTALKRIAVGPEALHLHLDLATWASDGLLAIFFFVVGVELKREFVAGDLRNPAQAAIPVVAAVGGMAAPALIYVAVTAGAGGGALRGWAIPTATDIAFALAVLAVIGTHLPSGLRSFLLTLAVVDDLLAIMVIAVFYTGDLQVVPLALALAPIGAFAVCVQRRRTWWWLLIPLAVLAWGLVHASGVHATVAGVLLGFTVPVLRPGAAGSCLAQHLEHRWRPVSAGFAVPVFAFFAAGVSVAGAGGIGEAFSDPVTVGVVAGLVVGKLVGVLGTTWLLARFTRARLDDDLAWSDMLGLSLLAGIGFTVALLIGELAFGEGGAAGGRGDHVRLAELPGSVVSAALAAVVLRLRNRVYRRIYETETRDSDADSIPDVYDPRPDVPDDVDASGRARRPPSP